MGCTTWARVRTLWRTSEWITLTCATGKLNGQAGPVEIRAVFALGQQIASVGEHCGRVTHDKLRTRLQSDWVRQVWAVRLTGHNIPGVHGILVLDEAKAIHQLDFGECARCILEVVLNVLLGYCSDGEAEVSRVLSNTDPRSPGVIAAQGRFGSSSSTSTRSICGNRQSHPSKKKPWTFGYAHLREGDCPDRDESRRLRP